ncbi:putative k+ homeostasis protein kha1 [Phaeomoniella chlamydospora]|uniref:Putative k+ homeostasis protein kha1 n=1 Tax=Phaeomoniella chlamydospora TaxID=158046 RepID=A0A0G2ES55_PHACM|nr:putative k+ homeostasis protein kha1 [Phaeomoniella chlamydospora]
MASAATTAVSTVTQVVTQTVSSASSTATSRVAPQAGIFEDGDPSEYDADNPIILFIIQAGIIIIFCRLLHYPLSKLRQPRVIAEVIGGVLLGPSVMGRIPGFTDSIFSEDSMAPLKLAANLGLLLFLFLVGLEVDLRFLLSNWRVALSVSAAGMALPFGLGCAIAYGLYHEFSDDAGTEPVAFGTFTLFIGIAMAITAFPVLCRILTELKLLTTPVGVIVLSAGVGNDVVGWILLALCVALVNSGSGIVALWVLLTGLGWTLFIVFAARPALIWVLRRTGSLQNGPTQGVMALTLLLTLTSAFFTGVIGIHPIFGAFLVGLICPHEGGFAIKVTEKLEDLVITLFLPLYFALSGLNTNLGLLDSGLVWGYVIGVIAIAFAGKIIGGAVASRLNGLVWRESFTIGCLMSCKGLVELIVLNIGLNAKILSTRTFTMFVVMALVTTFATTPLTSFLYPDSYQKKLDLWKQGKIDWNGNPILPDDTSSDRGQDTSADRDVVRRLLVYLRLDALPGLFTFITLMGGRSESAGTTIAHHTTQAKNTETSDEYPHALVRRRNAVEVHGLRLAELTERESSVMQVSEIQEYANRDPVVKTFRTFGQFNDVAVAGSLAVVPERSYPDTLLSRASDISSDLILIPWSETGYMSEQNPILLPEDEISDLKPLTGPYASFVTSIFTSSTPLQSNVAIFIDRGFGSGGPQEPGDSKAKTPITRSLQRTDTGGVSIYNDKTSKPTLPNLDHSHHIFVPYLGGSDDYLALRFALQLAKNESVTLTAVYFEIGSESSSSESKEKTITSSRSNDAFLFDHLSTTIPSPLKSRIVFRTETIPSSSKQEIQAQILSTALKDIGQNPKNSGDLVIVGQRANQALSSQDSSSGISNCLGSLAAALIEGSRPTEDSGVGKRLSTGVLSKASLVVIKSKDSPSSSSAGGTATGGGGGGGGNSTPAVAQKVGHSDFEDDDDYHDVGVAIAK